MAKEKRIPNYRKMYPEASEEVIALLRQGERKLLYHEYDLKVEKFVVDEEKQKAYFNQSREDSLERLIEADVQFYDEGTNVEEIAIKAIMSSKLLEGLNILTKEERELITALFYKEMTERDYAEIKGVYHNAIHKRKIRIFKKLENFLKNKILRCATLLLNVEVSEGVFLSTQKYFENCISDFINTLAVEPKKDKRQR